MEHRQSTPEQAQIEHINMVTSKLCMTGWFLGLAWMFFVSSDASEVVWWEWIALAVAGPFAASIVVGGGLALVSALITKVLTGSQEGSPMLFGLNSYVAPVLVFFVSGPIVRYFA